LALGTNRENEAAQAASLQRPPARNGARMTGRETSDYS